MPTTAPRLTRRAKRVVATFGNGRPGSRGQVAALRDVISRSSHLKAQLNEAVASGRLVRLEAMPPGTNAGGEYWPLTGTIKLPPTIATRAAAHELAFTLGHEVQHALNSPTVERANRDLYFESYAVAQSSHDYNHAIERSVQAHRDDEAGANLAGWNAMIDCWRSEHPVISLDDVLDAAPYRSADFIEAGLDESVGARPNIVLNADNTVDLSPHNIKGMGENFFDKPADQTLIGHHGDSDYINYYTAQAISQAASIHAAVNPGSNGHHGPPMMIDLAHLRASRRIMERNGIRLGDRPTEHPVPYVDISTHPPTSGHFHHTAVSHQHVPLSDQAPQSSGPSPSRLSRMTFAHPGRRVGTAATGAGTSCGSSGRARGQSGPAPQLGRPKTEPQSAR